MKRGLLRPGPLSRGQALVEFSLVVIPFLVLMFALVDLGRLVYINTSIAEAAREGARWGSVQGRSLNATSRTVVGAHTRSMTSAVPDPVVTVTCEDPFGNVRPTCSTGAVLVVQVDSSVGMLTPFLSQLIGPRTYSARSRMAVQN
jgi:Flp pilus assembly protein TadG